MKRAYFCALAGRTKSPSLENRHRVHLFKQGTFFCSPITPLGTNKITGYAAFPLDYFGALKSGSISIASAETYSPTALLARPMLRTA
jgi:hypothetical protein